MEHVTSVLKELIRPLLSRTLGATILFIFFAGGMFIALIAPTLISHYPLAGPCLIALMLAGAAYAIYRLELIGRRDRDGDGDSDDEGGD